MTAARKLEEYQYSSEQERTRLQVVKRRRRRRRMPESILIGTTAFVCVVVALLYLGQQLYGMQLSVKISQLEQELSLVQQRQDHLQLELIQARSLKGIESLARQQLGMVDPAHANVIVMEPELSHPTHSNGWLADNRGNNSVYEVVADWLNRWLPLGGVEAGRIGH